MGRLVLTFPGSLGVCGGGECVERSSLLRSCWAGKQHDPTTHTCVCVRFFTFLNHTSRPRMHGKTVSIDDLRRCLTFRPFFLLSARNPHMVGACGNVLGGDIWGVLLVLWLVIDIDVESPAPICCIGIYFWGRQQNLQEKEKCRADVKMIEMEQVERVSNLWECWLRESIWWIPIITHPGPPAACQGFAAVSDKKMAAWPPTPPFLS